MNKEDLMQKIKSICDVGGDLNQVITKGLSYLHIAATYGYLDVVQVLLSHGAEVDMAYSFGYTALMWAAEKGHLDVAQLLLDRGAAIDKVDNRGRTAFITAMHYGHLDVARFLLNRGAEVNQVDKDGFSALVYASFTGDGETAQFLLEHGADVDKINSRGQTAIDRTNNSDMKKMLKLGSTLRNDLIGDDAASYATIDLALEAYFLSVYIKNMARLMRTPLRELRHSIQQILLIANRLCVNETVWALPTEMWGIIIQQVYRKAFELKDGVLSFRIENRDSSIVARVNPQLSEYLQVVCDVKQREPVILKTKNGQGLVNNLQSGFRWSGSQ